MKHVLIVNGNPDTSQERLCSALAHAYQEGAQSRDCMVQRIDVGGIHFSMLRSAQEFATDPAQEAVKNAQSAFLRADHVVFIFPLWLGGPPALLKAFMEQLARDHFLIRESEKGFPKGCLKGRSARLIVTMGMPPLFYRTVFGGHGIKAFTRSILRLAGFSPIGISYFGGAAITAPRSAKLVEKVRDMGRHLA